MKVNDWVAQTEGQIDAITLLIAFITAASPNAAKAAGLLSAQIALKRRAVKDQATGPLYIQGMSKTLQSLKAAQMAMRQPSDPPTPPSADGPKPTAP